MKRHYLAVAILAVSTVSFTACSTNSQTSKEAATNTSPIIVKEDGHVSWSYTGDTGPEYWGDIEEASACKIGQEQSPINITRAVASASKAPTFNYSQSASLSIIDNGHTVVYTPTTDDNTINLNNERFELKQFHYHTPSEHQFGGQTYPAEIHFVHANNAGNLAVVGVMLMQGQENSIMSSLLEDTKLSAKNKAEVISSRVNLAALIPTAPTFYHYAGSLTTPPCSEQVQWYVTKEPLAVASHQLAALSDLYEGNNRPIQPQGSRKVEQIRQ